MSKQKKEIVPPSPRRMFLGIALILGGVVFVGLSMFTGFLP